MLKRVKKIIFYMGHLSDHKIFQLEYKAGSKAFIRAAFLTAALLMLPGAAMTSQAAVTWKEDGEKFRCYDREGEPVSDSWVKDSGCYYYIDEDGLMAADQLIEDDGDTYYVGSDGAMVKKQWVHITDREYMNEWFYFGYSGKAYKDKKRKIGAQTYLFDGDGCMLSGWQKLNGELYYLGTEDEGFIHTGWQLLEPWEEMDGDYEREEWFYFQKAGGKAYRDRRKKINGSYYYFDENGVTRDKWISASPSNASGTPGNALPSSASGAVWADEVTKTTEKGWVYTYAPEDEGGDQYWYYLDRFGVPFNAQAKDTFSTDHPSYNQAIDSSGWRSGVAAKVIDGKTYLFDKNGKMMTGLYYLSGVKCAGSRPLGYIQEVDGFNGGYYYFNEKEGPAEGQMMTGKQTIEEDGDDYYYYFQKNGVAYVNMMIDGVLFGGDGKRIYSEYNRTYSIVEVPKGMRIRELGNGNIHKECRLIATSNGKLIKNGTVEIDGVKYTVKNYEIIK